MEFSLRKLGAGEAGLHRELRLAALRDAPRSFSQRYRDAAASPDSYWEKLTRAVTPPRTQTMVLACRGDGGIGMAYGLDDAERPEVGHVGGMWVAPSWRGKGVGRALLAEVVEWGNGQGRTLLELWAPAHEAGALGLYRGAGFEETGRRRPFPADGRLEIVEMSLAVGQG